MYLTRDVDIVETPEITLREYIEMLLQYRAALTELLMTPAFVSGLWDTSKFSALQREYTDCTTLLHRYIMATLNPDGRIIVLRSQGGEIKSIYSSLEAASKEYNIPVTQLHEYCNGILKHDKLYWRYEQVRLREERKFSKHL